MNELIAGVLPPVLSGLVLLSTGGLAGIMVRWGGRISRALSEQAVINSQVTGNLQKLSLQLEAHKEMDTIQRQYFAERLSRLDAAVAQQR